jgi:polyisoprenyl-teichoic acid--peptidoglycan teichoic acid transferase
MKSTFTGGRLTAKSAFKAVLLVLALAIAAACAVILVDPLNWLYGDIGAAPAATAFPGVEEPSLLPIAEPVSREPFNILILGLDHGLDRPQEGNERTDTIIVAHVDEAMSRACLLSIPRDSYVNIPGYRTSKINEAYQVGGVELAIETVEQVTGMEMRNHIVVDFDELIWLVDLFGGVQVTLSEAISDPKLGNIPAGNQLLDGAHALIMARSRDYPLGDLERVRQQQRLLIQALYKGKELAAYPGAAWFLSAAIEPLESDLTRDELIRLARGFAAFPVVDVQGAVAPGRVGSVGSASVYLIDGTELRELVLSIEEACFVPERFR